MSIDPRTPVIVGVAQIVRRPATAADQDEPAEMMAQVLRAAADDAGAGRSLLERLDSLRVVDIVSWRYRNVALAVAERLGVTPADLVRSTTGGNSPQMLVNDAAAAIQRGEAGAAAVVGAEAVYTRLLARKTKEHLPWSTQDEAVPEPRVIGVEKPGTNDVEMARGILLPTQVYPIFENALRARAGESIDEHQFRISELWARFSEVAAGNPYAWSPERRSAEEIRTPTPDNRMIGFPYPKLMNANIQTDQAAGLVLCSVEVARALGVPEDRWVFVHAGADATDHWWVSERHDLTSSPAIRANGRTVFARAGVGPDDVAHVDLYSCFPSAVQIGAAELSLPLDDPVRSLTVTGGLGFAGGPANNYVTHSIAAMVEVLRRDPGSYGLVTALGWYVTKHSIGIYSTTPPAAGFRWASPQAEVDASPRRDYVGEYEGPVTIESYTVMHERDGEPANAIVACLLPDGRRAWGTNPESGVAKAMTLEEHCGRPARLRADGFVDLG